MARLFVHVEGSTEEIFVAEVLRPELTLRGFHSVEPRIVGNARLRSERGGIRPWNSVKRDIVAHLKEDDACFATTMFDYYGLPSSEEKPWPGRATAPQTPFPKRAEHVEEAMLRSVQSEMGKQFDTSRFVPFVLMHEFEALLFSDCRALARLLSRPAIESRMIGIRSGFANPEEINDSPVTAPSKRIRELIPEYQKPLYGCTAVLEIGLHKIRAECPHFDGWLRKLEALIPER